MSGDRRVHLDLSMPGFGAQGMPTGGHESSDRRAAPDPSLQDRFAVALAGDDAAVAESPATPSMPSFGHGLPSIRRSSEASLLRQGELAESLGHAAERLMVDSDGRGNRQVRIELKEDLLSGVSVAIQELEGRLQVDFFCSVEDSRQRLNRALSRLADTLAHRLGRDVLMRVQTDDDEDPCLQEALAFA